MTIEEIIASAKSEDVKMYKVIDELKSHRYIPMVVVEDALKALDPKQHDVMNKAIRKDKQVRVTDVQQSDSAKQTVVSGNGEESVGTRPEPVARIALALQKLIIRRAVSFCFGNPVEYNCTPEGENQQNLLKAFKRILYDVKSTSLNRKIGSSIFGFKECAECWYPVEEKASHNKYGFPTKYKIRCALFSPVNGDTLYPFFDETGDMVAFSRAFSRKDVSENGIDYFETFTADEHWLWQAGADGYNVVEGYPKRNAIGKIPIVYGYQPTFETEDVNNLIDRLEKLLSNFADTNDYHASPKIFVTGNIQGWSKKGEAGAVIEGEEGATMQYVSWANAPESVKLEIDNLLKMIYTITQTPDISFDSVKGIGAVSGVALKLLFMDAHLKVQDKREIFDEFLQRRVNILLAYLGMMNTKWEADAQEIEIQPEIVPYMITSDTEDLEYWMTANGNKPVISQEESIEKAGLSKNVEYTMQKLEEQSTRDNTFTIGEPVDA